MFHLRILSISDIIIIIIMETENEQILKWYLNATSLDEGELTKWSTNAHYGTDSHSPQAGSFSSRHPCWAAKEGVHEPVLEMTFSKPALVVGFEIDRRRRDYTQCITRGKIQVWSDKTESWVTLYEGPLLAYDETSSLKMTLSPQVVTRSIRLVVLESKGYSSAKFNAFGHFVGW